MKQKLKYVATILLACFVSDGYADNDQIYNRSIKVISTYSTFAIIYYKPSFSGTQGCINGNNDSGVLRFDNPQQREMFSTLLAAASANSNKIGFGISGCDTGNSLNRPKIYRIDITF